MEKKKFIRNTFVLIVISSLISLIVNYFSNLTLIDSLRIVFGAVYVLFLPGFIISYIFFPRTKPFEENESTFDKTSIDIIERLALSFALSIAIIPLVIFYLNLIGVKISALNSFFIILGIIIISLGIIYYKNRKNFF